MQSSVDIDTNETMLDPNMTMKFINFNGTFKGILENNGRSINFDLKNLNKNMMPRLRTDSGSFILHSFTLHMDDSLHQIDGENFGVEIHLINYNENFQSMKNAMEKNAQDSLAVVSFLFRNLDGSQLVNHANNKILNLPVNTKSKPFDNPTFPKTSSLQFLSFTVPFQVNFDEMLPLSIESQKFFRYYGSLTEKQTCVEMVEWTLFEMPLDVLMKMLLKIKFLKF